MIPARLGTVALLVTLFGCTSTFLASKDGKGYYLGSGSPAAYEMFCASGDLSAVLADTKLPQDLKDPLFAAACSEQRSGAAVKELYGRMTADQRKDLRTSFKRHGFDINYLPC